LELSFTQSVKGRFILVNDNEESISIKIQLASDVDSIMLGNSTLRFAYNDSCLELKDAEHMFHQKKIKEKYFSSITIPSKGVASVNIAHKGGEAVLIKKEFTDLITLKFRKATDCRQYEFIWILVEIFEPASGNPLFTEYWENLILKE
jgi:hypothetical protein